jgi:heme exporter protein D
VEFLEFDKYAAHMWAVYLLALVLIIANSWWSRRELAATRASALRRVSNTQQQEHIADGEAL